MVVTGKTRHERNAVHTAPTELSQVPKTTARDSTRSDATRSLTKAAGSSDATDATGKDALIRARPLQVVVLARKLA